MTRPLLLFIVHLVVITMLVEELHSKVRRAHRMHSKARHGSRVIGGEEIDIGRYPFLVQIENWSEKNETWEYGCAGSILTPKVILTACHCISNTSAYGHPSLEQPEHIRIIAGLTNTHEKVQQTGNDGNGNVQMIYAEKLIIHPECANVSYTISVLDSDAGVIELANEVRLIEGQVELLPIFSIVKQDVLDELQNLQQEEAECSLMGWGFMIPNVSLPDALKEAKVSLIPSQEACVNRLCEWHPSYCGQKFYSGNQVCAARGGVNACQGDSGSPLVCNGNVFGILSWIKKTCEVGNPNMFASVEPVWYFIEQYRNE